MDRRAFPAKLVASAELAAPACPGAASGGWRRCRQAYGEPERGCGVGLPWRVLEGWPSPAGGDEIVVAGRAESTS